MKSIGNDIIDLNKIDIERTITQRFYSRFVYSDEFSDYETSFFCNLPFAKYVWLLWSVKESAYKYLKRFEPELVFSPINVVVSKLKAGSPAYNQNLLSETVRLRGEVLIKQQRLFFQSAITEQYISSVVNNDPDIDYLYWDTQSITNSDYASQSFAARQLALNKLSDLLPGRPAIYKCETGYPVVHYKGERLQAPLSLAHHGNYVAYSFLIEPQLLPA